MRLLFVEDEENSIDTVKMKVQEKYPNIECEVTGFSNAEERIKSFGPDIVSLDLLGGAPSPESEVAGQGIFDAIWENRFCPIIIYSAQPDADDDKRPDHPFLKSIKKGRDSPLEFVKAVNDFQPHVEAIRRAEVRVRTEFAVAMREVAPYAFEVFEDAKQRDDTILRCGRRRLAALMDDLSRHGHDQNLASWEQYLCPPVSHDIQLGDILQKQDSPLEVPDSFLVVLTPSCDLIAVGGRKPKVTKVLVASCCPIKDSLGRVGMQPGKKTFKDEKLLENFRNTLGKTILSQGYYQGIIPLPCLKDRIPTMAADLRKLDLIPIDNIALNNSEYIRVASIDSPFRELISWAYLQIGCRPGLPDRDCDAWCAEIIDRCQNSGDGPR